MTRMLYNKHLPFWLITLSTFIGLIVPVLIQDGMFMDGLQYVCVAKNLAEGLGSFWFPHLSQTWAKAGSTFFMEHPPLVYAIESFFFKALGDSMYVERFYSFFTALVTAFLIILIWKLIHKSDKEKFLAWLPVLLWITIPLCFWSYQNNMMENTMGIFTCASVFFSLKGLSENRVNWFWLFLSGIFIFLASFSKGIPGLFPLAVPVIYGFLNRQGTFSKMISTTAFILSIPTLIYFILMFTSKNANDSLSFYFYKRLLQRIQEEPTTDNNFYILSGLFQELIVPALICLIFYWIGKLKSIPMEISKNKKNILFFFLVGASGSFPLLFTSVQRKFYFVHALPFYAVSFALLLSPTLLKLVESIQLGKIFLKVFRILSLSLLSGVIIFSTLQKGKMGRDEDILNDVYQIGKIVPRNSLIHIDGEIYNHWSTQFYFIRYFNISLDPSDKIHEYYMREIKNATPVFHGYRKLSIENKKYCLYQKEN